MGNLIYTKERKVRNIKLEGNSKIFPSYLLCLLRDNLLFKAKLMALYHRIFFVCLFRVAPVAYGSSQARGQNGAAAAGLHHSHSNAGSEQHLRPIPQLTAILDP